MSGGTRRGEQERSVDAGGGQGRGVDREGKRTVGDADPDDLRGDAVDGERRKIERHGAGKGGAKAAGGETKRGRRGDGLEVMAVGGGEIELCAVKVAAQGQAGGVGFKCDVGRREGHTGNARQDQRAHLETAGGGTVGTKQEDARNVAGAENGTVDVDLDDAVGDGDTTEGVAVKQFVGGCVGEITGDEDRVGNTDLQAGSGHDIADGRAGDAQDLARNSDRCADGIRRGVGDDLDLAGNGGPARVNGGGGMTLERIGLGGVAIDNEDKGTVGNRAGTGDVARNAHRTDHQFRNTAGGRVVMHGGAGGTESREAGSDREADGIDIQLEDAGREVVTAGERKTIGIGAIGDRQREGGSEVYADAGGVKADDTREGTTAGVVDVGQGDGRRGDLKKTSKRERGHRACGAVDGEAVLANAEILDRRRGVVEGNQRHGGARDHEEFLVGRTVRIVGQGGAVHHGGQEIRDAQGEHVEIHRECARGQIVGGGDRIRTGIDAVGNDQGKRGAESQRTARAGKRKGAGERIGVLGVIEADDRDDHGGNGKDAGHAEAAGGEGRVIEAQSGTANDEVVDGERGIVEHRELGGGVGDGRDNIGGVEIDHHVGSGQRDDAGKRELKIADGQHQQPRGRGGIQIEVRRNPRRGGADEGARREKTEGSDADRDRAADGRSRRGAVEDEVGHREADPAEADESAERNGAGERKRQGIDGEAGARKHEIIEGTGKAGKYRR